ncbi:MULTISPECIES: SPOR domain-containing protein [unclassified Zunongwangia]|uniref:SPOR domain-containing protein n=1 Tax=unclassified Zunongwangia TaxID=2632541 RepID=UPI0022DDCC9D|nr:MULTISPECIES: SPOR domain-containing protein [unclassified Zunongwangia]WBL22027.1 SPOR domain-containing protein [Zunongwangia sp. HRR-M8]WBL26022.1 SPOR domain-containing protein [Zunongwangia sp. HGR-M22]
MNILSIRNISLGLFLGFSGIAVSQENSAKINISEDEMITQLIDTKTELQKSYTIGDRFAIQIFSGNSKGASEEIKHYESLYNYSARIKYEEPNYKVWVGNFRNRIEADRALLTLKEAYPSAFIPKPKRK